MPSQRTTSDTNVSCYEFFSLDHSFFADDLNNIAVLHGEPIIMLFPGIVGLRNIHGIEQICDSPKYRNPPQILNYDLPCNSLS